VLRIKDVEAVMVEGRKCPDDSTHNGHRMGIAAEAAVYRMKLLVHHRVVGDVVSEFVELGLGRQFAVEQQPADFQIVAALDEIGDRIAAVEQNAVVAVDIGDRRSADPGLA
jgi:hypothetical protein